MSNKKILEHVLERKLVNAVKKIGGLCLKLTNYKGIPDRLILFNGMVVFVELKQEGKYMRIEQEMWERILEKKGFEHFLIDNEAGIDRLVSSLTQGKSEGKDLY